MERTRIGYRFSLVGSSRIICENECEKSDIAERGQGAGLDICVVRSRESMKRVWEKNQGGLSPDAERVAPPRARSHSFPKIRRATCG